ncbi:MAG: NUDIX domain-containing protein [bacterium]|nr:NUDIX domain-containing protein [bacterium]
MNENKILLVKKVGGPYDGKLDLPGGTIEFLEKPEDTLIREIKEETKLTITDFNLLTVDSINLSWIHKTKQENIKHIFILYKINDYTGKIKEKIKIDNNNDDSKGALFYDVNLLKENELSNIAYYAINFLRGGSY